MVMIRWLVNRLYAPTVLLIDLISVISKNSEFVQVLMIFFVICVSKLNIFGFYCFHYFLILYGQNDQSVHQENNEQSSSWFWGLHYSQVIYFWAHFTVYWMSLPVGPCFTQLHLQIFLSFNILGSIHYNTITLFQYIMTEKENSLSRLVTQPRQWCRSVCVCAHACARAYACAESSGLYI